MKGLLWNPHPALSLLQRERVVNMIPETKLVIFPKYPFLYWNLLKDFF
jgi:hypothetical protein